jgi:type III restriction enzyme
LSLFFIDKVANYRSYDSAGIAVKGKFAEWFEEIYQEYISKPVFKEKNLCHF